MSDAQEHERRLFGRERGLAYVGEPTWADVQRRRAEYAAWSDEILELETSARTVDEVVNALMARI